MIGYSTCNVTLLLFRVMIVPSMPYQADTNSFEESAFVAI